MPGKGKLYFDAKSLIKALRNLTDSLPNDAEKAEVDIRFKELIQFLDELRQRLNALPSMAEVERARASFEWLENFAARAQNSAVMSAALGLKTARPRKQAESKFTDQDMEVARRWLQDLERLPIDEIQSRLRNESQYSGRQLNAMASLVGIRITAKTSREALIERFVSKIANFRGYMNLSAGKDKDENQPR